MWRQRDPDAKLEDTVEAAKSLLEQYRTIVERNKKTVFLFGAQKIGSSNPLFPFWTKKTRDEYMSQLRASIEPLGLNYIWFDDDERIQLVDSMHTDEKSGRLIADIYATWIEEHRSQLDLEVAMTCPWPKQR